LRVEVAFGAVAVRFGLGEFGTLAAVAIDWDAHADCELIVGAELGGVGALPYALDVEIRIKIH